MISSIVSVVKEKGRSHNVCVNYSPHWILRYYMVNRILYLDVV